MLNWLTQWWFLLLVDRVPHWQVHLCTEGTTCRNFLLAYDCMLFPENKIKNSIQSYLKNPPRIQYILHPRAIEAVHSIKSLDKWTFHSSSSPILTLIPLYSSCSFSSMTCYSKMIVKHSPSPYHSASGFLWTAHHQSSLLWDALLLLLYDPRTAHTFEEANIFSAQGKLLEPHGVPRLDT